MSARVHWARVDGRAIPVGVDIRSFVVEPPEQIPVENVKPSSEGLGAGAAVGAAGGWHEITTTILRDFPLLHAIEESRKTIVGLERWATTGKQVHTYWVDQGLGGENAGPLEKSLTEDRRPRRGPEPLVPDQVIRDVVVPAYLDAGTKPVEAVRQALERWQGKGVVTRDRAAAAVRRARRHGWLPTSARGTK